MTRIIVYKIYFSSMKGNNIFNQVFIANYAKHSCKNLKRYVAGKSKRIVVELTQRHNRSISRTPETSKMEFFVT